MRYKILNGEIELEGLEVIPEPIPEPTPEPPPEPEPEPDDDIEVTPPVIPDVPPVVGEGQYYFAPLAMPESIDAMVFKPVQHRMYSSPAIVDAARSKLGNPKYDFWNWFIENSDHHVWQALNYVLTGDLDKGIAARNALLAGNIKRVEHGYQHALNAFMLTFSWIFPLFENDIEIQAAIDTNRGLFGTKRWGNAQNQQYAHNDFWAKYSASHMSLALLLAEHDAVARQMVWSAYNTHENFFSPWHYGGMGMMELLAGANGGGDRVGNHSVAGTGYEWMFQTGMIYQLVWDFATNEQFFHRTSYFRKLPQYLALAYNDLNGIGGQAIFWLNAICALSDDAQLKGVSAWLLDNHATDDEQYAGDKGNLRQVQYLLSDRDVEPIHPEDAGLSLHKEVSNCYITRDSWEPDSLIWGVHAREIDVFRYEPDSGAMFIHNKGKPVLCRNSEGKGGYRAHTNSGLLISQPDGTFWTVAGQSVYGSNYWHKLAMFDNGKRTYTTERPSNDDAYPMYWPDNMEGFNESSVIVESANLLSFYAPDAVIRRNVWREGNAIYIADTLENLPEGVIVYHNLRVPEIPGVSATTANWGRAIAHYPSNMNPAFMGGLNQEMISPWSDWTGNKKAGIVPGYSTNDELRERWGIGSLIAPIHLDETGSANVTVKIEVL